MQSAGAVDGIGLYCGGISTDVASVDWKRENKIRFSDLDDKKAKGKGTQSLNLQNFVGDFDKFLKIFVIIENLREMFSKIVAYSKFFYLRRLDE